MSHKPSIPTHDALWAYIAQHDTTLSEHAQALYVESAALPLAQRLSTLDTARTLSLLLRLHRPRTILEIGTFTGFATLVMAEAASRASVVTIDKDDRGFEIAARYWQNAAVQDRITAIHDDAHAYFTSLSADTRFDMIFIDADKGSYQSYVEQALSHLTPEGIIIIDNTLWRGLVCDAETTDKIAQTMRTFNQRLASDPRLTVTILPIGDGLTVVSTH